MRRFAFSVLLCALPLAAQITVNKASIGGLVADIAGAPIPLARIIARNNATGLERDTTTNDSGVYRFDGLDPGTYDLKVDSAGSSVSVTQVPANVGDQIRVNITLSVVATSQLVDISDATVPVTESSSTKFLTRELIEDLPINGRRFQDFATLAPAVQALTETRGQLSIAGQRGIYSNVLLDGADYNEPFLGGIRGGERSTFAFTIPQSAIEEFQAVSSGFSAEYGHSTGGVLNVLTRSGSNALHGSAFYHIRDGSMGVNDPLGFESLERQHQFGGGIGGPILKDRLFFFGAAEQQLASYPRGVSFPALDEVGGQITPAIAPAYAHFRSLEGEFEQTNDATAVFGRLDYQRSSGSRFTGRYHHSRNTAVDAVSLGASLQPRINQALGTNGDDAVFTHTAGGQWTAVLPRAMVNDLRAQYTREETERDPNSIAPYVEAGVIGSYGTNPNLPNFLSDYRFQVADGLSFLAGRHSAAIGFDYSRIGIRRNAGANQFGSFYINGTDTRRILRILSGPPSMNRFDDPSVIYRRQVGSLAFDSSVTQTAIYAQDTWRATHTFALTYGIRWEGQFNPQPIADNEFLLANVRDFEFPIGRIDPTIIHNPTDQFAPKLSFAWDVLGRQRTVVRGQVGYYYGQSPLFWLAAPIDNVSTAPSDLSLEISPAGGRTVYQQFRVAGFDLNTPPLNQLPIYSVSDIWMRVAGEPNPFAQANVITTSGHNYGNPRSLQTALSVEHTLLERLTVSYQFRHLNTVHLERNHAINMPRPFVKPGDLSLRPTFGLRSGTPRPNPNLGWVMMRDSSARATFQGHTVEATYRTNTLQVSGHYTLSFNKSDDDNERELVGLTYQNPFDFSREYNWSSLDARHQAAGSAIWNAPAGIEISSVFRFRTGLPLDASTGGDTSELLSGNLGNRPLESPGVFMLRNAFRNRDFKSIDFRVAKSFVLTETARLHLYTDLFNAFDFDNVAFISATVNPNNRAFIYGLGILPSGQVAPVDPRFMRLRNENGQYDPAVAAQQGIPFQAQLGLRLVF